MSNISEVVNIHRLDPTNIGDMAATPCLYFDWLRGVEQIDIMDPNFLEHAERLRNSVVIFGGGGVLFDGEFTPRFLWENGVASPGILRKNLGILHSLDPRGLILWGAGHNSPDEKSIRIPDFLKLYDLVGLRDYYDSDVEHSDLVDKWVPCSSCLHPELDNDHKIEHDVVIYDHKDHRIPDQEDIPVLTNTNIRIEEAIQFLASGETVVTTSYHGAYWGILLGRRVILSDPFSTKFQGFKYTLPVVTDGDWQSAYDQTQEYPEALEECRVANYEFAEVTKKLIEEI